MIVSWAASSCLPEYEFESTRRVEVVYGCERGAARLQKQQSRKDCKTDGPPKP